MADTTVAGLQLRSTVKKEGILELSLATVATPEPKPEEVVVRIDASPINPSDQGLLFGGADMSTARASGTPDNPVVTANISPAVMKAMAGRLDQTLPVGNEGAGVVVRAGASPAAQALLGKTVATGRRRSNRNQICSSHPRSIPNRASPRFGEEKRGRAGPSALPSIRLPRSPTGSRASA